MADRRSADEQQKLLLEIIKRFDGYINATNSKIAVVLSYCMAYIDGLGFKLVDLSDKREHDCAWWLLLSVSLLSVLATLVAAHFAYRALKPQTPPGRALQHRCWTSWCTWGSVSAYCRRARNAAILGAHGRIVDSHLPESI